MQAPLESDNKGFEVDEEAQLGSEERGVGDGMEEPSEMKEVKQGGEPANEAKAEEEETAIEPPSGQVYVQINENTTTLDIDNTHRQATMSSHQEEEEVVHAGTSLPPTQPQEAETEEGAISDTETVLPEEDNIEPYVFNWRDVAFIDETGHLDTYQRAENADVDPTQRHLARCHWIGLTDVDKPWQHIKYYPGPVDASGQHPTLRVPELKLTTPEGDTWWLEDPVPWGRLCMNWQWLSHSYVDDDGFMDTRRRASDEERRELVARGKLRLQRDNWVLSKWPPLAPKNEGVPDLKVTVPGGQTFYLDEPKSWADFDDDDEDW